MKWWENVEREMVERGMWEEWRRESWEREKKWFMYIGKWEKMLEEGNEGMYVIGERGRGGNIEI